MCPFRVRSSLPVAKVPQLDVVIEAGGGQDLAVGAEGQAVDQAGMAFQLGWGLCRQGSRGDSQGDREQKENGSLRNSSQVVQISAPPHLPCPEQSRGAAYSP